MPARKNISGRRPSARRMLAAETRLRQESGKSLGQLAEETTYDRTYLHKLETGARIGSPEVIAALDKVYGTGDRLMMLWELAREDAFPDKYKRWATRSDRHVADSPLAVRRDRCGLDGGLSLRRTGRGRRRRGTAPAVLRSAAGLSPFATGVRGVHPANDGGRATCEPLDRT
ncbi:helix-turn-helix domain-containing protein [Streptomyces sp. NPDC020845]|uniref:helix-turn-helix domain-containing protein n=1 Tax=Streptomyces sp. NPDC020845 TaxID=3365096 RepID=UPI0037A90774